MNSKCKLSMKDMYFIFSVHQYKICLFRQTVVFYVNIVWSFHLKLSNLMTFTEHVIYFKHLSYLVLYLCDLIVQQQIDSAFTSPVRQVRQTKIALTFDNDNHVFKSSLPVVPFINLNHQKYKYPFFRKSSSIIFLRQMAFI